MAHSRCMMDCVGITMCNRITVLTGGKWPTSEQLDKLFTDVWEAFYHYQKTGFVTRIVVTFENGRMVYRKAAE